MIDMILQKATNTEIEMNFFVVKRTLLCGYFYIEMCGFVKIQIFEYIS